MKLDWIKSGVLLVSMGMLLASFYSCGSDTPKETVPDVSHLNPQVNLFRLDSIFALSDKEKAIEEVNNFFKNYPAFANVYFKKIVPIYSEDPAIFKSNLSDFLDNEKISNLLDTTQVVFPNMNRERADLKKAMSYYMHYFPDAEIPNFYSLISEFGIQSFIFQDGDGLEAKDGVGIGLDMFLGKDFNYKQLDPRNPAFSDYITEGYQRNRVIRQSMEVILDDQIGTLKANNLLAQMINEGKKLYILDKILPFLDDHIVLGFSKEKLQWLKANEIEMWSFFLENDLIYETSVSKTFKYINPSPSSPGMPAEAPGRTGVYIGFKIVERYMSKNPNISLDELILEDDYQKMIKKYKPPRKR